MVPPSEFWVTVSTDGKVTGWVDTEEGGSPLISDDKVTRITDLSVIVQLCSIGNDDLVTCRKIGIIFFQICKWIFTFELDNNKVDGQDTSLKLKGAEFKLRNNNEGASLPTVTLKSVIGAVVTSGVPSYFSS